jgi:aspartyl-tRNA(Asn)/glutamyl-tRNA(Gln) amidotransferase subunit C
LVAVSIDEIRRIADLSKLAYEPAEMERFVRHFQEILDYFAQLTAIPTDDVAPTYHALEEAPATPFRVDEAAPSLSRDAAVANAPDALEYQFRVPKVIE